MCMNKNEIQKPEQKEQKGKSEKKSANKNSELMMSDLLSAISETEYPQYILEAVEIIRDWIHDAITKSEENNNDSKDIFAEFFGELDDEAGSIDELYSKLGSLEEFANIVPNSNKNNDKADTLIISLAASDYDSGLRAAIDYAAVFNRPHCKRVWIVSDTFIFDEIIKFVPHVEALSGQGINLRFILVTAWGWVELPLSESSATKNQFLWRTQENKAKPKRRK